MSDCVTFGGFTDAFLTMLRDEFPKLPSLAFSFLSDASNVPVTAEEVRSRFEVIRLMRLACDF